MKTHKKARMRAYRFYPEDVSRLAYLATVWGVTRTEVIRRLLAEATGRERAKNEVDNEVHKTTGASNS